MDLAVLADVTKELVVQNVIDAISFGSLYALLALGVALTFGIMRLVNFAYGELIMAGGYAIVLIALPVPLLIPIALLIVIALALATERIAFRPLRGATPATLLIASFAVSYLLQNIASLTWGSLPRTTDFASGLNESFSIGSIGIQKLDVLVVSVTVALLVGVGAFLGKTTLGVQMRAAAEDFRAARVLGVRANTVIAAAFALSGLLAAVASILLIAQTGTVTPTVGVNAVTFAFIATVFGGMASLPGAVLGGFLLGALSVALQASLPLELRPYRDAFVFTAVLAVLIVRPEGLLRAPGAVLRDLPRRARLTDLMARVPKSLRVRELPASSGALLVPRSWRTIWAATIWPLVGLMALTSIVAVLGWAFGSDSLDRVVVTMLINLILVVGLYTFVGVSGVFSFGHVAFMAIGAYVGAILVIPVEQKAVLMPDLPGFLSGVELDPIPATLVAGGVAAVAAAVLAVPLSRLSGLTAGLATFAVLLIVNVVAKNWQAVTRGTGGISGVPTSTTFGGALGWALVVMLVAWMFQRSRIGLRLRASREDEPASYSIGVSVGRERGVAFVLSAFLVGAAGALFGMFIGSFSPDAFYLNVTFLITAMLIIGGMTSLAGAVVGTIVISALSEFLRRVEMGIDFGAFELSAKPGLREVGLALVMLLILLLRPAGLMGGKELRWPGRTSRLAAPTGQPLAQPEKADVAPDAGRQP